MKSFFRELWSSESGPVVHLPCPFPSVPFPSSLLQTQNNYLSLVPVPHSLCLVPGTVLYTNMYLLRLSWTSHALYFFPSWCLSFLIMPWYCDTFSNQFRHCALDLSLVNWSNPAAHFPRKGQKTRRFNHSHPLTPHDKITQQYTRHGWMDKMVLWGWIELSLLAMMDKKGGGAWTRQLAFV